MLIAIGFTIDDDPTFTIYWQNRLVPQSQVLKLPFFPELSSRSQCNAENIAVKWRYRVKGFLFFDWNQRISNNKLKLQIPDLNGWLNDKARMKSFTFKPTAIPSGFKRFLQMCHQCYDREYHFDQRDTEAEAALPTKYEYLDPTNAYFHRMKIGSGSSCIEVSKNMIIKLKIKRQVIYGKIEAFAVKGPLDSSQVSHDGLANVLFRREPSSIFGEELYYQFPSVKSIDFTIDESWKASHKDFKALEKIFPVTVRANLFEVEGNESIDISDTVTVMSGMKYYKIGIQLLNEKGNVIYTIPQSTQRYKVQVVYDNGAVNYGTTNELWYFDPILNKDVKYQEKSSRSSSSNPATTTTTDKRDTNSKDKVTDNQLYYCFGNMYRESDPLSFKRIGEHPLQVNVIDDYSNPNFSRTVLTKVFKVNVNSIVPQDFTCNFDEKDSIESTPFPFGSFPKFEIVVTNSANELLPFVGNIMIRFSSPGMEVKCDGLLDPIFNLSEEDNGSLFFDSDWAACPLVMTKEPNPNHVELLTFSLQLFLSSQPDSSDESLFTIPLGSLKTFKLQFCAGRAAEIQVVEPAANPVRLSHDDVVQSLRMICLDRWGNRTMPNGTFKLEEGPLKSASDPQPHFNINSDGSAECKDIQVQALGVGFEGLECKQVIKFLRNASDSSLAMATAPSQKEKPLATALYLYIQPKNFPSSCEVC